MTSWMEISRERLAENYRVVSEAAGAETAVLAVVKANAYGHGLELCSVELARAGAKWLGVGTANEGARVRAALDVAGGVCESGPGILVMCGILREDVGEIVACGLTPVVWTAEQVGWLAGSGVRVHVEIETGMGRQGVRAGAAMDDLLDAMKAGGVEVDGVMTHFAAAEVGDQELTRAQEKRFEAAVAQVRGRGLRLGWVHAGSSSSVDNAAEGAEAGWLVELAKSVGARAMVRCGIALYGYCLPIAGGEVRGRVRGALEPVMTWKTRVIDVRDAVAGETFGYNAMFTAEHAMRVALLRVGYADGLRRELSSTNERGGGWVGVRGADGVVRRAEIVGRVSMNLTMVDVTGIEGVRVGDEVVLLGDGVTAEDHARLAGTIAYEILCGVRAGSIE
ncbi:MAG TPA: alanine racemase [Acidobacteriaceae bacterium]|nr:alanine racemase [Acidobacteriaceae bacterium]